VRGEHPLEGRLPGRGHGRGCQLGRRHGPAAAQATDALFGGVRAPSNLESHLRSYAWGNVLQIAKADRALLARLCQEAPLLPGADVLAFVDIDSS
jgi:hypothetical protein